MQWSALQLDGPHSVGHDSLDITAKWRARTLDRKVERPAARFGIPAGPHGAADVLPQPVAVDIRAFDPAAFAKRIFQDQFAMGFVFALNRQPQADMLAPGAPDLLALQRPAQRIALDFEPAA